MKQRRSDRIFMLCCAIINCQREWCWLKQSAVHTKEEVQDGAQERAAGSTAPGG